MSAFDIGFVPSGWERGDPLRIRKSSRHARGYVAQDITVLPVTIGEVPADAVYAVHFNDRDVSRVEAWLKWWNE